MADYVKLTDFKTRELRGTTHGTANTQRIFRHASGTPQAPTFWIPLEGSVYIPADGMGPEYADVRSTKTSEPFRILLFY